MFSDADTFPVSEHGYSLAGEFGSHPSALDYTTGQQRDYLGFLDFTPFDAYAPVFEPEERDPVTFGAAPDALGDDEPRTPDDLNGNTTEDGSARIGVEDRNTSNSPLSGALKRKSHLEANRAEDESSSSSFSDSEEAEIPRHPMLAASLSSASNRSAAVPVPSLQSTRVLLLQYNQGVEMQLTHAFKFSSISLEGDTSREMLTFIARTRRPRVETVFRGPCGDICLPQKYSKAKDIAELTDAFPGVCLELIKCLPSVMIYERDPATVCSTLNRTKAGFLFHVELLFDMIHGRVTFGVPRLVAQAIVRGFQNANAIGVKVAATYIEWRAHVMGKHLKDQVFEKGASLFKAAGSIYSRMAGVLETLQYCPEFQELCLSKPFRVGSLAVEPLVMYALGAISQKVDMYASIPLALRWLCSSRNQPVDFEAYLRENMSHYEHYVEMGYQTVSAAAMSDFDDVRASTRVCGQVLPKATFDYDGVILYHTNAIPNRYSVLENQATDETSELDAILMHEAATIAAVKNKRKRRRPPKMDSLDLTLAPVSKKTKVEEALETASQSTDPDKPVLVVRQVQAPEVPTKRGRRTKAVLYGCPAPKGRVRPAPALTEVKPEAPLQIKTFVNGGYKPPGLTQSYETGKFVYFHKV